MISVRPSRPNDVPHLLAVWRGAVLATHSFLASGDLRSIEREVAQDYLPAAHLLVAVDEHDLPLGFMGLTGAHIDALFVDPARHGQGVGRILIEQAGRLHPTLTVDVNEQNDGALAFYERLGFVRRSRSPQDDAGRPYPLLHLSRPQPRQTGARASAGAENQHDL